MLDLWVPLTAYYHQLTPYSSCKVLPVTDGMWHWWNVCQISDKWKSNEMHYHSKVKYAELGKHWFFDGIWCCQFFDKSIYDKIWKHQPRERISMESFMYFFKKVSFICCFVWGFVRKASENACHLEGKEYRNNVHWKKQTNW